MGDGVDELDIALLDALHLNPLASFEELGTLLDVAPVTAARRWRRLVSSGRAWVSSAPGLQLPMQAALFEAECQPGAASAVASKFASIPQVFSVNITTGKDNLYALVVAADQPLLAELIVDTLPAIAGLNRVRSGLITQLFSGTRWRLGGLSPDQIRAATPESAKTVPAHEPKPFLHMSSTTSIASYFWHCNMTAASASVIWPRRWGVLNPRCGAGWVY